MVRVLIVDDHEIARSGLRLLLAGLPGVEVAEAGSAREAREVLLAGGVDLLLLDLSLPDRDGLEFLADLRASGRRPRTLVVSAFSEAEFALRCLQLGAAGYVAKTSGSSEILAAVRKVMSGGKYLTPNIAERLATAAGGEGVDRPAHEALTTRELQVLRLVARGLSLKQAAAELHLGERTVSTYRARLGRKLGLGTNVELVRYALQHKLVE